MIRAACESGGFCEVPAARDRWVPRVGDLIEARLNEGAAGFARGLWELYFTRWQMSSLGVALNGDWWFLRCDEGRRVRWKRPVALILTTLANLRAYGFIAGR
jgi:hypothetical protein